MKHKIIPTDIEQGEGLETTSSLQPMTVSDELISRLAGKCEEIFPIKDRRSHHEITDEEVLEMESILKRFQPAPVKFLFREQCCSLMCAESERGMESLLKRLSASPLRDFSVSKLAQEMKGVGRDNVEHQKQSKWRRLIYFSGFSAAAAIVGVLMIQNGNDAVQSVAPSSSTGDLGGEGIAIEQQMTPSASPNHPKRNLFRPATPFELHGDSECVPVMVPVPAHARPNVAPPHRPLTDRIHKILPGEEY